MLVKEIMSDHKVSISPNDSLTSAVRKMRDKDIGCLLVEENGKLRGVVTDRDVACRGLVSGLGFTDLTVSDIMSRDVIWCTENEDVEDAVRLMEQHQVRRLPVMAENEHAVGMLGVGDISAHLSHELTGEVIAAVSTSSYSSPTAKSLR